MKLKQIKTAYKNLELIIHKKRFLIPNKPVRPLTAYIKFVSQEKSLIQYVLAEKKKQFQGNLNVTARNLYNNTIKQLIDLPHPAYLRIKQESQKQSEHYLKVNKQYNQKFIKAAQLQKPVPFAYFVSKFYHETKSQNQDLHQKQIIKLLGKKWKEMNEDAELSDNEQKMKKFREEFFRQFEQVRKNELKAYQEYIEKHEIPKTSRLTGYNIYISDMIKEDMKFGKQANSLYAQMSAQELLDYEQRAAQKTQKLMDKYHSFLKSWDITHQQLLNIRKICDEYQQATSKTLKKNLKEIIGQQPLLQSEEPEE